MKKKEEKKFIDKCHTGSYLKVDSNYYNHKKEDVNIRITGTDLFGNTSECEGIAVNFDIWLDIPTAEKLATTLRNEIKKALAV